MVPPRAELRTARVVRPAVNEPSGKWQFQVRDLLSGFSESLALEATAQE